MSYLQRPRIHFHGRFEADTSTVNNDVRHYDTEHFKAAFQEPMEVRDDSISKYNGYWNPDGSAAWRLIDCRVTGAALGEQLATSPEHDPAVGMVIGGSNARVAGKLVDLDPQQQMVSQIWGLSVRLVDAGGCEAFGSEFEPAAFSNLWARQQNATEWFDQTLAAAYQSVLTGVEWGAAAAGSPVLEALRDASSDGALSIRMNVFGYDRTPTASDYGTGIVVGAIGPASESEPRMFSFGRHLVPEYSDPPSFTPTNGIGAIQADAQGDSVTFDFGNAFPITDSTGSIPDLGELEVGVLKDPATDAGTWIAPDRIEILGRVAYKDADWYFETAGIESYALGEDAAALIADHPLAVVRVETDGTRTVLNREGQDGLFVKADHFVFRLNPGEDAEVDLWASKYGQGLETSIFLEPYTGLMGGAGTGAKLDESVYKVPKVGTPPDGINFPSAVKTGADGHGRFAIEAAKDGPGNPREFIDGQLYGIGYSLQGRDTGFRANAQYFISVLAWDRYTIPETPTWFGHVKPILQLYSNLYPIMSRGLFDLADYDRVVEHLQIMELSFGLPVENPNHMPVTRDMSLNKRETIRKWLRSRDTQTGLPPMGELPNDTADLDGAETAAAESAGDQRFADAGKREFARLAIESNDE